MWKPVDIIVLALALSICWVLFFAGVAHFIPGFHQIDHALERMQALEGLTASMMTVISMYVGHKIKGKDK